MFDLTGSAAAGLRSFPPRLSHSSHGRCPLDPCSPPLPAVRARARAQEGLTRVPRTCSVRPALLAYLCVSPGARTTFWGAALAARRSHSPAPLLLLRNLTASSLPSHLSLRLPYPHRPREPPRLVSATSSRTRSASAADAPPSTTRRRSAPSAATPRRRFAAVSPAPRLCTWMCLC
jgi:hypothetical protein